jgi:hypothetical protein
MPAIASASSAKNWDIALLVTAQFSAVCRQGGRPVIATFVLANSNLLTLYLVLGAGLAAAACHHLGQARNR